ncbi:sugar ABC transporter permease [Chloroflexi bacterium TSY]|nr:sugar ABC transporter permease [Chloroflexi bacterium TSY]
MINSLSPLRPWARLGKLGRREALACYLFILPWFLGFLLWQLGPMVASFYLSLTRYSIAKAPLWIGMRNYVEIYNDELFWQSLKVTLFYTAGAVPLGVLGALFVATLMYQKIPGRSFFRTLYYLPTVTSGVAVALLWAWVFQPQFGLANAFLWQVFGIEGPDWFFSEAWVLPAFIIMSLWSVGGPMLIYLAGMQGVPTDLYEAADLDGANGVQKYIHITIPMITPVILFNMIMSIIGSFQVFVSAYVITQGGPNYGSFFYVLYLYQNAFQYFRMGFASGLAWILFLIVLCFTLLTLRSSRSWVYYAGQGK